MKTYLVLLTEPDMKDILELCQSRLEEGSYYGNPLKYTERITGLAEIMKISLQRVSELRDEE